MLRFLVTLSILSLLSCGAPQRTANDFSKLNWLLGNWKGKAGEVHFYEEWKRVSDTEFSNINYSLCNGEAVIAERGAFRLEGTEIYSGGGKDRWRVTHLTDQEVVLENPDIAYARKITHRRTPEGKWHARIEGQQGVIEYLLTRIESREELTRQQPRPIIGRYTGEASFEEKRFPVVFNFEVRDGRQELRISDPTKERPDVLARQLCYDPPQLKFVFDDGPTTTEFVVEVTQDEIIGTGRVKSRPPIKVRLKKAPTQ